MAITKDNYRKLAKPILAEIKQLLSDGVALTAIAGWLGVRPRVVYKWRRDHPEFDIMIEEARSNARIGVEKALLKRAVGYDVETKEMIKVKGILGTTTTQKITTKHLPPDKGAIEYFLSNNYPDEYSKKADVSVELPGVIVVPEAGENWNDVVKKQQALLKSSSTEAADEVLDG